MKRHWTESYGCVCGMKFRSYAAEGKHRHNFPRLCRKGKKLDAHFALVAAMEASAVKAGQSGSGAAE